MDAALSDRIKSVRLSMNMTQVQFGARLGVTRDVICNIEKCRANPRQMLLKHICDCYGVSEDWLFFGTGEMFSHQNDDGQKLLQDTISGFNRLKPVYQDYVLQQIQALLKLQKEEQE